MKIVARTPIIAPLCNLFHGRRPPPPQLQRLSNKNATFTGVMLPDSFQVFATKQQLQQVKVEEIKEFNTGIGEFYNEWSEMWENVYDTDHIHVGFYDPNSTGSIVDLRSAQDRMIEEAILFANISDTTKYPKSIVDIGCGLGGTSRYLAKKFGANCVGITLSPFQVERANDVAAAEGLADKVSFQVADALEQPFSDGKFDLLWSMESAECMPDKEKFVAELARVAAPGATIVIVSWCHRDLKPGEEDLQQWEKDLLNKISDLFLLPPWVSSNKYVTYLDSFSFQDIKTEDWSTFAAPFWPALVRSTLTMKGLTAISRCGPKTIKAMSAYPLMIEGFEKGVIKHTIITCRKPSNI